MKIVMAAVAAVLALVGLTACGDNRPCLHSHPQIVTTYVMVGKVLVPITSTERVCDKRAPRAAS